MEYQYGNIEMETTSNNYYRRVLSTTCTMQLVLMMLRPHESIGQEIHPYTTQFIKVEKGNAIAVVEGKEYMLSPGSFIMIPPGYEHNIINTSKTDALQLYTIYSPPEHPRGKKEKYKTD